MGESDWLGDVPKDGWKASHGWRMPEWVEPIVRSVSLSVYDLE